MTQKSFPAWSQGEDTIKPRFIFMWGLCQSWNDKSILLQILYPCSVFWKIPPLYFLSSNNIYIYIYIYFVQKEPIKVKILETFDWSGQNLSNSLCQFWNNKWIPLQILHPYLVSWKITPLYFFSPKNIYFAQKEPIKMKIFGTFKCSDQNSLNSSGQLWNDKSVPLQTLHNSSLSWQITPLLYFKFILFQVWMKGSNQNPSFECSGKNVIFLMSFSKPQGRWK